MKTLTSHPVINLSKTKDFRDKLKKNLDFIQNTLEFSLQKKKMSEILGWDLDVVIEMENLYIKFLALNKTLKDFNQNFKIIPNRFIDEFWHTHILDTAKYMEDCNKIFGEYFHHYPYYGMRNEKDKQDWFSNAEICQYLWENLYNENLYGELKEDADSYIIDKEFYKKLSNLYKNKKELWAMGCSRCRTCKPVNCP